MSEQIYLTAKEAREIASTSTAMRNHLYKQIKEEAKQCHTETTWCVYGCTEDIITKLVDDLTQNGYNVFRDLDDDPEMLVIKW